MQATLQDVIKLPTRAGDLVKSFKRRTHTGGSAKDATRYGRRSLSLYEPGAAVALPTTREEYTL